MIYLDKHYYRALAEVDEQLIKDLLGQWVSELEPLIVRAAWLPRMPILGIGAAGHRPSVWAPGTESVKRDWASIAPYNFLEHKRWGSWK